MDTLTIEAPKQRAPKTISLINRAAVKRYALAVAKSTRAHPFTRVSEAFLDDVEAKVDARIRQIGPVVRPIPCKDKLCTNKAVEKFEEVIQAAAQSVVCQKIASHPSAGRTLV